MTVLSPAAVEGSFSKLHLPFTFSEDEQQQLNTTLVIDPGPRILAFPTPQNNQGLNLLNMRRLVGIDPAIPPSFFDHPWYLEEPFGFSDCEPGWHFIHMDVSLDSIEQPYDYIRSLKAGNLALPSAVEVVLMLFLHYLRTGEHLLLKKHTWCRDQATLGRMVTVGAFGRNGVFVSGHPPTFSSRGLGICGKILNPPTGEPFR